MIVELPSAEERASILQKNAARFPAPFVFTVPGDGGKDEKILLLLGNPTKDSPAWEQAVAATLKPRSVDDDQDALVAECVIWPDQVTWGGIVRRWPALPDKVGRKLRVKYGGALSVIEEPKPGEEMPALVKEAQARNAGIVWRRLQPSAGETIDIAIQPPDYTVWQMFQGAIAATGAKCWPTALDFATASAAACSMSVTALFERWPGTALLVALVASRLAGLAAEVEQGEF